MVELLSLKMKVIQTLCIRLSWLLAGITATAAYEGTAAAEAFHSGSGRVFPRSGI